MNKNKASTKAKLRMLTSRPTKILSHFCAATILAVVTEAGVPRMIIPSTKGVQRIIMYQLNGVTIMASDEVNFAIAFSFLMLSKLMALAVAVSIGHGT